MAGKKYVVTGEYVTVKTGTPGGPTVVGLYRGAPWPEDAEADATQHHLDNGLIEEVGKADAPPPPPEEPKAPAKAEAPKQAGGRG